MSMNRMIINNDSAIAPSSSARTAGVTIRRFAGALAVTVAALAGTSMVGLDSAGAAAPPQELAQGTLTGEQLCVPGTNDAIVTWTFSGSGYEVDGLRLVDVDQLILQNFDNKLVLAPGEAATAVVDEDRAVGSTRTETVTFWATEIGSEFSTPMTVVGEYTLVACEAPTTTTQPAPTTTTAAPTTTTAAPTTTAAAPTTTAAAAASEAPLPETGGSTSLLPIAATLLGAGMVLLSVRRRVNV
jgi:LPXTG-motif cell wall-anchored protein